MTSPTRYARRRAGQRVRAALLAISMVLGTAAAMAVPGAASAAPGDEIGLLEVEDGVIAGGPGRDQGDHSNFSGSGSYTFREAGMSSTMTVDAPAPGVYPVHIRYSAGPTDEIDSRTMSLVTNGVRQQVPFPRTVDWETWRFATTQVTLVQGPNTLALRCDRPVDTCRLNFDAVQVGGATPETCAARPASPGYRSLYDGTFASFDAWRKAGGGGFGRQTADCSIQTFRGRGAEWLTEQQTAPYTLQLAWRRQAADDESSVYLASTSRGGADPVGGFRIPIGADTGAIVPTGGTARPADQTAVAGALRPVGQWNTYQLQVSSTRVRVYLNGTLVNTYDSPQAIPASGFIGLENRGATHAVSFRDIEIKAGVDPDRNAPQVRYAFEEGVGTTAANTGTDTAVGPATLTGGTTWSPSGIGGKAVDLPGGSNANAVDLPDNLLKDQASFTTSFWARPDTTGNWIGMFHIGDGLGDAGSYFQIQMQTQAGGNTGLAATFKKKGSSLQERVYAVPTKDVAANTWNHVAFTRQGAVGTLYLNGQQIDREDNLTLTMTDIGPTTNNWLGRNGFNDPAYDGLFDDVRLYTGALPAQDIAALYADGTALPTTTTVSVAPASPSRHDQPLTVSATVKDSADKAAQGTAQLWVDGAQVGAATSVVAGAVTFDAISLSAGQHAIEVRFTGSQGWRSSIGTAQHTVQRPPAGSPPPIHYPFDEGQGATAANTGTSSSVGAATFQGSVGWASGMYDDAVSLPGGPAGTTSNHVNLPNNLTAGMDAEFTVSTWIRPTQLPSWTTHLQIGKSTQEFFLLQSSTSDGTRGLAATLRADNGDQHRIQLPGKADLPLGRWTHVVVTLAPSATGGGTTGRIYLNGQLAEGGQLHNIPVDIGDVGAGGTTANFVGNASWNDPRPTELVDDLRFYGYALSADEVATLFAGPPVNAAPVGAADQFDAVEGSPLAIPAPGVLANDTDSNDDRLTATGATQPANGQVVLATDGSFTYTPSPGFAGTDSFTYRASDGTATSSPTTVTLTVKPATSGGGGGGGGSDTPDKATTAVSGVTPAITYGRSGSVAVAVSPAAASGTVRLSREGTALATGTLVGGRATLALPAKVLPPGVYDLALRYGGDGAHEASSATVRVTVLATVPRRAGSQTVVRARPEKLAFGEDLRLVTTIRSSLVGGATPTGEVRIRIDGRLVAVGALVDGRHVLRVRRNLGVGSHMVSVTYQGDAGTRRSRDRQRIWVVRRAA